MRLKFHQILINHFSKLVIGPPSYTSKSVLRNIAVYPLLLNKLSEHSPEIITMRKAINLGVAVTDKGIISRVHVENKFPTSILAMESQLLLGNTQERSIQYSCLLAPKQQSPISVNCVEEGQPTIAGTHFTGTDACPWPIRSFKNEQLARHGEPKQFWLWERVANYLKETNTNSSTKSLHAVLTRNTNRLNQLCLQFPYLNCQTGVVISVGSNLYAEIFSDPELLEDCYQSLLRSAVYEALDRPSEKILPPETIQSFLNQISSTSKNAQELGRHSTTNKGQTYAFAEPFISGQVLVAEGRIIHLSAHQRRVGKSQPMTKLKPVMDAKHSKWENTPPIFLAEVSAKYNKRKRRYKNFKNMLKRSKVITHRISSEQNMSKEFSKQYSAAPLNLTLHKFFIKLFTRNH